MDTPQHPPKSTALRRAGLAGLLGAALLTGLWGWSGSEGSLASGLRLAGTLLPSGMTLHSQGAQGSLRHGGRIAQLDWQQDGLSLQAQSLEVELDMARLLRGELPVQRLQLGELQAEQRSSTAATPLQSLQWPLRVDLDWRIDRLRWQAGMPLQAIGLQGHYRFDGQAHRLRLDNAQWAQGRYQGTLQVQAAAPMAMQAQLQGQVQGLLPTLALQARAELKGHLAGADALLALQAEVQPNGPATTRSPGLQLQAELHPQAERLLGSVQAQWQGMDLAALWPGAPHTRLDGRISAPPSTREAASDWQADIAIDNHLPGPWDQARVPLQSLRARAQHTAQGWALPTLQARWPGGQLQGQMQFSAQQAWQGQWRVERLQVGQWWSAWNGPALSGTLQATQTPDAALALQARLTPEGGSPDAQAPGLLLQARREGSLWTLSQLQMQWADAQLQAQGHWRSDTLALDGQADLRAPGLQGQLRGQMSAQQGQGQWRLDGHDSQRWLAWLQRWPALGNRLQAWQAQGRWQASGQWQGGWASPTLQLQAELQSERLAVQGPNHRSQLEQVLLHLSGPVQALQVQWRGRWLAAAGQAELQGQGLLGRSLGGNRTHADWQGQITHSQLGWRASGQSATLQLLQQGPLAWQWRGAEQRLQWQAQRWALQGPDAQAALQLQAGHWQAARRAGAWPHTLVQVRLDGWPARWASTLGLAEWPGDLLLQGGIDLRVEDAPQLQAWLERSRGDWQLRGDSPGSARVPAGLREASARLTINAARAALDLRWDSEQAGQLEAHLDSRIDPAGPIAALWPADAPLAGRVQARLPRVGAWSWLAPPGWRVQGGVDARFEVAGTRSQPRWQGTLQADDLALRSAIEGVELRQGRLRARLQEQALWLDELTLQGAGAQGGELRVQGQVQWQPQDGPLWQTVQMDLQAQARALRVSSRADRRLIVSGQTRAQWLAGRMHLSGELQADSAQFILPEDSAPTLGPDVVIVPAAPGAASASPAAGDSLIGTPEVQLLLRLGPDFQLRGRGIRTRLAGELQLRSGAASQGRPRLSGEVRTEGGRYKAYGQELDVEQGLLRFAGPYDNPALDILALRPQLPQRVGVRVTGTAQAPRVRLYAEPEMPDADTLAWLVLGRSPAAGGAESAVLQQAALALLGGNGQSLGGELANALGLDAVSLANRSVSLADGSTTSGAALMLGKRLSKDFYLAYESSVSGAMGSLFMFYELSRKLSLRAQTGEYNALDLVYTIRRD